LANDRYHHRIDDPLRGRASPIGESTGQSEEDQLMDQMTVLQQVIAWARREDTVRVVVLTGSVARGEGAFDEWSDLDIELYVSNPSALLDHDTWYEQFGEVLVVEALENPGWHPTPLVYYADGKIDFIIAPTLRNAGIASC
jgi:aminoglycoside 6-adenylyltransferase